ncbi:MAG TPA: prephenate dehydrogenase/arogenate dehydrogenase family protein [Bryobacteraceae bacterium]|nr:prephenate dehydrogenase/arogenate dehydrogenase family protein [Bryobacteraceae bacterium]
MESVAIIGVGLIGGSMGLALRAAGFNGRIVGVSSPGTIEQAVALGAIDAGVTLEQAAGECDLLYLAQPISAILKTLDHLGTITRKDALITDAGSTKVKIVGQARRVIQQSQFLGGHPMAGKESRGVGAASADLFRGRPYVLTPLEAQHLRTPAAGVFIEWLKRCGTNIVTVTPEQHDRAVAFISHLPQMASTALAACLSTPTDDVDALELAGPGITDMSRLALSSYEIWQDILATNSENIEHALSVYIDKLTEVRDNLQTLSLGPVFASAARVASRIRQHSPKKGRV